MTEIIPALTVLGFAAIRVLPAIQRVYTNFNTIRYYSNSLDIVYGVLSEDKAKKVLESAGSEKFSAFQEFQSLNLKDIEFCYEQAPASIFREFNLTIPKDKTIAFTGETGAGKSTVIDILMGLLMPVKGALYYGQTAITSKNVSEYRKKIGYVPQHIFLIDGTLEANIAFGISENEIDHKQLKHAIQVSQLESTINDLPAGTKTLIGERGIKLSGGQRQRVAIARALYNNPEILVMDEATSALDGYTEAEVTKAIKNLYGKLTIIIIAHRLTTIESADVIYVMDRGRIVGQGSFRELLENSAAFKKIANQITT